MNQGILGICLTVGLLLLIILTFQLINSDDLEALRKDISSLRTDLNPTKTAAGNDGLSHGHGQQLLNTVVISYDPRSEACRQLLLNTAASVTQDAGTRRRLSADVAASTGHVQVHLLEQHLVRMNRRLSALGYGEVSQYAYPVESRTNSPSQLSELKRRAAHATTRMLAALDDFKDEGQFDLDNRLTADDVREIVNPLLLHDIALAKIRAAETQSNSPAGSPGTALRAFSEERQDARFFREDKLVFVEKTTPSQETPLGGGQDQVAASSDEKETSLSSRWLKFVQLERIESNVPDDQKFVEFSALANPCVAFVEYDQVHQIFEPLHSGSNPAQGNTRSHAARRRLQEVSPTDPSPASPASPAPSPPGFWENIRQNLIETFTFKDPSWANFANYMASWVSTPEYIQELSLLAAATGALLPKIFGLNETANAGVSVHDDDVPAPNDPRTVSGAGASANLYMLPRPNVVLPSAEQSTFGGRLQVLIANATAGESPASRRRLAARYERPTFSDDYSHDDYALGNSRVPYSGHKNSGIRSSPEANVPQSQRIRRMGSHGANKKYVVAPYLDYTESEDMPRSSDDDKDSYYPKNSGPSRRHVRNELESVSYGSTPGFSDLPKPSNARDSQYARKSSSRFDSRGWDDQKDSDTWHGSPGEERALLRETSALRAATGSATSGRFSDIPNDERYGASTPHVRSNQDLNSQRDEPSARTSDLLRSLRRVDLPMAAMPNAHSEAGGRRNVRGVEFFIEDTPELQESNQLPPSSFTRGRQLSTPSDDAINPVNEQHSSGLLNAVTRKQKERSGSLRSGPGDASGADGEQRAYVSEIWGTPPTPNDPKYGSQWNFKVMDAPYGWEIREERGPDFGYISDFVVAVLDTGCDLKHKELVHRLWKNEGEICDNGIDDDGNGYIDDCHGFNFYANNADLSETKVHGTPVSGGILAETDNAFGIASICMDCRLMCNRVGETGFSTAAFAEALNYALGFGVKAINYSGNGPYSQVQAAALESAQQSDAVFVTCAGNAGCNIDTDPKCTEREGYPAKLNHSFMLTVGATDQKGELAKYSNRGALTVDLLAPSGLLLPQPRNGFKVVYGTSFSAPVVTGLVGLIRSTFPTLSAEETVEAIRDSCRKNLKKFNGERPHRIMINSLCCTNCRCINMPRRG